MLIVRLVVLLSLLSIVISFINTNNKYNKISITKLSSNTNGIFSKLKTIFKRNNDIKNNDNNNNNNVNINVNIKPSVRYIPPPVENIDILPDTKIAIIGAGIAGLACAKTLSDANYNDYIIIEKEDSPGGRVRTDKYDGYLLDRGFQVFLDAYPESKGFFDYDKLQLQQFLPGAIVQLDGSFNRYDILSYY